MTRLRVEKQGADALCQNRPPRNEQSSGKNSKPTKAVNSRLGETNPSPKKPDGPPPSKLAKFGMTNSESCVVHAPSFPVPSLTSTSPWKVVLWNSNKSLPMPVLNTNFPKKSERKNWENLVTPSMKTMSFPSSV